MGSSQIPLYSRSPSRWCYLRSGLTRPTASYWRSRWHHSSSIGPLTPATSVLPIAVPSPTNLIPIAAAFATVRVTLAVWVNAPAGPRDGQRIGSERSRRTGRHRQRRSARPGHRRGRETRRRSRRQPARAQRHHPTESVLRPNARGKSRRVPHQHRLRTRGRCQTEVWRWLGRRHRQAHTRRLDQTPAGPRDGQRIGSERSRRTGRHRQRRSARPGHRRRRETRRRSRRQPARTQLHHPTKAIHRPYAVVKLSRSPPPPSAKSVKLT